MRWVLPLTEMEKYREEQVKLTSCFRHVKFEKPIRYSRLMFKQAFGNKPGPQRRGQGLT